MDPKKIILLSLAALPSISYWFWHFAPDFGKSWAILGIMWVCIALSLVAFLVSLGVSIKRRTDISCWAVTAFSITPMIDFFFH
jgi:hypothetical protein